MQPLEKILHGKTEMADDGFPIIAEESFKLFLEEVPHLFLEGHRLLETLAAERKKTNDPSVLRAATVVETMVRTANVTAPTDLWLLHHILTTYAKMGILDWWRSHPRFSIASMAEALNLDAQYLKYDLDFLLSRKILFSNAQHLLEVSVLPQIQDVLAHFGGGPRLKTLARHGWAPTVAEIEYGFHLVPLVLSMRKSGMHIETFLKNLDTHQTQFLQKGGLIDDQEKPTGLGARVFQRGPGPFGIIFAYQAYLQHHEALLRGNRGSVWVARGENIAASKDANAATFARIHAQLDRYCKAHQFKFKVFIEHAVGYGEATRQRFLQDGETHIQYFGADLEDAAIDRAIALQEAGELPRNMKFIRQADIGKPEILIEGIRQANFDPKGAVMVVGNGFHEVRRQTNATMVEVFRGYCTAGILLIFTEESALTNEDLIATAWNTYHAGFRYTHAISGQELRPAYDADVVDSQTPIFSWKKCAEAGGYRVLKEFSSHTRRIFPHPRPDGRNPAISVSYFCVPAA